MRALHKKLSRSPSRNLTKAQEDEFSDDLPRYLLTLSHADLENLISSIEANLTSEPNEATVHMYTIHAYKGLEDDVVVVYNDIDPAKDPDVAKKLLYVAVTRGRREVYLEARKLTPRGKDASTAALMRMKFLRVQDMM
jgi:superfamily I DNA/RNA helicase